MNMHSSAAESIRDTNKRRNCTVFHHTQFCQYAKACNRRGKVHRIASSNTYSPVCRDIDYGSNCSDEDTVYEMKTTTNADTFAGEHNFSNNNSLPAQSGQFSEGRKSAKSITFNKQLDIDSSDSELTDNSDVFYAGHNQTSIAASGLKPLPQRDARHSFAINRYNEIPQLHSDLPIHNSYTTVKQCTKEMSCDAGLRCRTSMPPVTRPIRKSPNLAYNSSNRKDEVKTYATKLPDLYDSERAMGCLRDIHVIQMKDLALVNDRESIKRPEKLEPSCRNKDTGKFIPGVPRLLMLSNLPAADTTPKTLSRKRYKEPINAQLFPIFDTPTPPPTSQSQNFPKASRLRVRKTITRPCDLSGDVSAFSAGATQRHIYHQPARPSANSTTTDPHTPVKNKATLPGSGYGPNPDSNKEATHDTPDTKVTSSEAGKETTRHSPDIKVTISHSDISEHPFHKRSSFDNFSASIVPLKKPAHGDFQGRLRQGEIKLAQMESRRRVSMTRPTPQQYGVDVQAQARQHFAEDRHRVFATARVPIPRRSPAVIADPRSPIVVRRRTKSRKGKAAMGESLIRISVRTSSYWPANQDRMRVDQCDVGCLRYYPWAPFDQAKVKATCQFILQQAERSPLPHQDRPFPSRCWELMADEPPPIATSRRRRRRIQDKKE